MHALCACKYKIKIHTKRMVKEDLTVAFLCWDNNIYNLLN